MGIKNYCSTEIKQYMECLAIRISKAKEEMDKIEKEKGGFDSHRYNSLMGEWCALLNVKGDLKGISHKLLEGSYWSYLS